MTAIAASVQNLLASLFATFRSILDTLLRSLQSALAVFGTALSSVLDLIKGLFGFLLSNFLILAVLAAAFVGYTIYAQRAGKSGAGKKTM